MILVDDRQGSKHLGKPLRKALGDEIVCVERMESADIAWAGRGPDGSVLCGVEVKQVQEMLGDMTEHRFTSVQLPRMVEAFDYRWLLI